jgi:divinyl protochlorophyllide a 8-vinyl-reductase
MAAAAARIGPNAITRLAEALAGMRGAGAAREVFARAGLAHHLEAPPQRMVAERDVIALHAALAAAYLLAHRIPPPMRRLLPRLPARLAARILLAAVGRHAWTFAGCGRFARQAGRDLRFVIAGGPLAAGREAAGPVCAYYAATFETLFRALVHPRARIVAAAGEALGAPACLLLARWAGGESV